MAVWGDAVKVFATDNEREGTAQGVDVAQLQLATWSTETVKMKPVWACVPNGLPAAGPPLKILKRIEGRSDGLKSLTSLAQDLLGPVLVTLLRTCRSTREAGEAAWALDGFSLACSRKS